MKRTDRGITRVSPHPSARPVLTWQVLTGGAALLLAAALAPPCRADSTLSSSATGGGPLTASAHLDFRITVLPTLGLAMQASGVRIQGNSGVLTLQRDAVDAWDGRAPATSAQLRPHRQVVDTSVRGPSASSAELITVASP